MCKPARSLDDLYGGRALGALQHAKDLRLFCACANPMWRWGSDRDSMFADRDQGFRDH